MKKIISCLFPSTEKSTDYEIDCSNLKNIFYAGLIVICMQLVAFVMLLLVNSGIIGIKDANDSVVGVGTGMAVLLPVIILSGVMLKSPGFVAGHHKIVECAVIIFCAAVLIWGMFASTRVYADDRQIITFYTVELCVLLFVKLKPWISAVMLLSSYLGYYVYLELFVKSGMIDPYNYLMFALLSAAGATINYNLTVGNIEKKNRIESLNKSLQLIANHDSLTCLKNRHALNHDIPDYLNADICVAMGDIDKFKQINDRFGHQMGDKILRHVSDVMLANFPGDCVYRYGGDEFLIIMSGITDGEFQRRLDSVNERLAKYRINDTDQKVVCSFGFVSAHAASAEELIRLISKADERLYMQKKKKVFPNNPKKPS